MNQFVRPIPQPSLVPDPNARKDVPEADADAEVVEGQPGKDENAAGFLKNVIDKPVAE